MCMHCRHLLAPWRWAIARAVRCLALTGAVLTVAAGACAVASASPRMVSPPKPHPLARLPPQGIFDGCDIDLILAACEARLHTVAAAGLKLIVEPIPSYSNALWGYLGVLHHEGLQAMWEVTDPGWWGYNSSGPFGYSDAGASMLTDGIYASWAHGCGCQTNAQLLAFIVATLTASSATYGWDVPHDSELSGKLPYTREQALSGIRAFTAELRALAPDSRTLMSAWGLLATTQLEQAYGLADLTAQEAYPVGDFGAQSVNMDRAAVEVGQAAQATQQIADRHHGPSALILQSFSWGECTADAQARRADPSSPYPDAAELLTMRNAALSHSHPALILWYDLEETIGWATGEQPADCRAPRNPAVRLAGLTAAVKAPYPGFARAG